MIDTLPAELEALVRRYAERLAALDVDGLAALWDLAEPGVTFIAGELRDPVVGRAELIKMWQRLAGRIRDMSITVDEVRITLLTPTVAVATFAVAWSIVTVEVDVRRRGRDRATALLRNGESWRFVYYTETPIEIEGTTEPPQLGG